MLPACVASPVEAGGVVAVPVAEASAGGVVVVADASGAGGVTVTVVSVEGAGVVAVASGAGVTVVVSSFLEQALSDSARTAASRTEYFIVIPL